MCWKSLSINASIAEQNIQTLIDFFGDRIDVAFITGTDFGTQRGQFISTEAYREMYKPFHERVNGLIHEKSNWKTFIHSCGSVFELVAEFIEAGFDILNPGAMFRRLHGSRAN